MLRPLSGSAAIVLLALLGAQLAAGPAAAQVDCGPGGSDCTDTRYGLGLKPDYRSDEVPSDPFRYSTDFFGPDFGGQSYFVSRASLGVLVGTCGPERQLAPLPGQILLRERTDCVPTAEGPICTAGANAGTACHLPALNQGCTGPGAPSACCAAAGVGTCSGFQTSATNIHECGTGGVCALDEGDGCRVEIVNSDGGITPAAEASEVRLFSFVRATLSNGQAASLSGSTGNTIGGTSFDGVSPLTGSTCTVSGDATQGNVRRKPSMGTRYLLPASRGGGDGATYVRFDSSAGLAAASYSDLSTSFRIHTDDSATCCAPDFAGGCNTTCCFPGPPEYPVLSVGDCNRPGRFVNEDNVVPDWVFATGRGSAFHTDRNFVVPGQIPGQCKANRAVACYETDMNSHCAAAGRAFDRPLACCTGPGTGTCTTDTYCAGAGTPFQCCTAVGAGTCGDTCPTLDADPSTAGLQPDACDLSTPGPRVQVGPSGRVPFVQGASNPPLINDSRRDWCGSSLYVLRGTPHADCALVMRFDYHGDPGPDCGLPNYGVHHRDDRDCDGVADLPDLCPFHAEWDQAADGDGDCAAGGNCRGDECECGDQDGNGAVSVSDLVAINQAIFGSAVRKRLCDANNDIQCDVSDIVSANRESFVPASSLCRQVAPRWCGKGVPSPCCGNGLIETGETCDDEDFTSGDGCSAICRVEHDFTCTGEPSTCS